MKPLFSFIALFVIVNCINAQTVLTGTVTDKKTNAPLIGATVFISKSYDGTVTNNEGTFLFTTTTNGNQTLTAKFVGYEPVEISVDCVGDTVKLNIVLQEKFNELKAVTITSGAFEAGDKKKSVTLSSIDMVTVPGAQGSVIGALQYLPGTSTNAESGKLFVRGGNSEESQTYIDGTLVPVAFSPSAPNTAVRSRFNPFLFDGTVFSTGGFSAEYGQALSSVLLLDTKGLQEQDQLDISVLSVGLGLAGTKKWDSSALTLSFDHTNLTPYMNIVPQGIDWIKMPISNNAGLNYRVKTKKGLFKVYGNYNDARFQLNRAGFNNEKATAYDLKNQNSYINTSYTRGIGKKWILKAGLGVTHNTDEIKFNTTNFKELLTAGHFKTALTGQLNRKINVKTGAELFLTDFQQKIESTSENFNPNYQSATSAAFAETNIHLSHRFVMRIGGRVAFNRYTQSFRASPRISAAFKTGENSQISAAVGHFYQDPSSTFLIYSDQLQAERADQYMLSYQWSKDKRTLRSEIYYKGYKNLVKFNQAILFFNPITTPTTAQEKPLELMFFFVMQKQLKMGTTGCLTLT